jgi:1-acyl-sn-glycerol-3-phosphate acyltransferase
MIPADLEAMAAQLMEWMRVVPIIGDLGKEIDERIRRLPTKLNEYGYDPWGFQPDVVAHTLVGAAVFYRYWFRAETHGIENLPTGRMLVIGNHAGQIAIDAMMVSTAMVLEAEPPRIVRGMAEYWLPTVPFINVLMARTGSVVGTRKNCVDLLEAEETVIAFPAGVRGIRKLFNDRYQLKEFGLGFMRLALEARAPVVPVAVIGSEEQAPGIANVRWLARLLGLPAFPVTLTWPHLGLLGLIPFPVKYHIYFGEPMYFEGYHNDEDEVIGQKVEQVKQRIEAMIEAALEERRERGPIYGIFF